MLLSPQMARFAGFAGQVNVASPLTLVAAGLRRFAGSDNPGLALVQRVINGIMSKPLHEHLMVRLSAVSCGLQDLPFKV